MTYCVSSLNAIDKVNSRIAMRVTENAEIAYMAELASHDCILPVLLLGSRHCKLIKVGVSQLKMGLSETSSM